MRNVYIAGRFEARDRLRAERDSLHRLGVAKVVSYWLDAEESASPTPADSLEYARRDLDEILEADLLILDNLDENIRGGREVEFGYALAAGLEVWVVGPKRNVFHSLACHFDTWSEVRLVLAKEHADTRAYA